VEGKCVAIGYFVESDSCTKTRSAKAYSEQHQQTRYWRAMKIHGRIKTIASLMMILLTSSTLQSRVLAQTARTNSNASLRSFHLIDINLTLATATISEKGMVSKVTVGQHIGSWTLMALLKEPAGPLAVLEDITKDIGNIVYLGKNGSFLTLSKTAEPTSVSKNTLYAGHTLKEIGDSKTDLLSPSLLPGDDDPIYADVAAALPPLRVPSFVGTPYGDDKPTWDYGAFSDEIYVDLGKLFPEIQQSRQRQDVREGLIGGWLPVLRFVFPAGDQRYWEESLFADVEPGHFWTQPVWFRALLIDHGQIKESHYFYHHLPFPPRGEPAAAEFYHALLRVHTKWQADLKTSMQIDVPDARLADFNRRALSLQRITRVNDHPKYGYPPLGGINVFGGYGYNNVDTFQDTFNSDVTAFVEWGSFDIARRYIDDYFTQSVRADGSIDTRGPEIGQYGKMLTTVAKYYSYTGDSITLRKYQQKLFAIAGLLESLHADSRKLPESNISYGIIRGWSEHDSSLKQDPYRFMQPHFANNAEAARGFHDIGEAWLTMANKLHDHVLEAKARNLLAQSSVLRKDMESAMQRSIDGTQSPAYVPAVAGDTPTYGKQRAYMEMFESGELTQGEESQLRESLSARGNLLFGLPRSGDHITGFLDFGTTYASMQFDHPRQFLLSFYAHMAHIYSPGTWTSVESAKLDGTLGGPYCTPSQVTIPILTKWMLVFEDPANPVLWLGRATPREWLETGKHISITGAPTRFGTVGYEAISDLDHGKVMATVHIPINFKATVKLRLRTPGHRSIRTVKVDGTNWTAFSSDAETIDLPGRSQSNTVHVTVEYE
jgi:hypothetical protein